MYIFLTSKYFELSCTSVFIGVYKNDIPAWLLWTCRYSEILMKSVVAFELSLPSTSFFFKAIIDSFFLSIFSDFICTGHWLFHCWPLLLSVHGAYFSLSLRDVHGVHLLNVLSSLLRGRSWHCSLFKFHMMFVYWACTQFFGSCVSFTHWYYFNVY